MDTVNLVVNDACKAVLGYEYPEFSAKYNKADYDNKSRVFLEYFYKWINQYGTNKDWFEEMKKKFKPLTILDTKFKNGMVYIWTFKKSIIYIGSTSTTYYKRYNGFDKPDLANYKNSYANVRLFKLFLDKILINKTLRKYLGLYCYPTKDYKLWEARLISEFVNNSQLILNQKIEGKYKIKLIPYGY